MKIGENSMNKNQAMQWGAALVLGIIAAFLLEIVRYKYGRFRTEDFWFMSILGLSLISHWVILLLRHAISANEVAQVTPAASNPTERPINDQPLIFKTNSDAFNYICKYMDNTLKKDAIIPALVMDSKEFAGTEVSVKKDNQGIQTALLKVASDDGGFLVLAQTPNAGEPDLIPGNLVGWHAFEYSKEIAKAGDERSGWVGFIVAKLAPELDIKSGWKITNKYA